MGTSTEKLPSSPVFAVVTPLYPLETIITGTTDLYTTLSARIGSTVYVGYGIDDRTGECRAVYILNTVCHNIDFRHFQYIGIVIINADMGRP